MTKNQHIEELRNKDSFYATWSDLCSEYGSGIGKDMNHIAIDILNRLYAEHYKGRIPANMILEYDLVDLIE